MASSRTKRRSESGKVAVSRPACAPRKQDRRVLRTRDALGDAIVALMQEQPFDSITVQQVLDRAGVARSTFYTHFSGTNDLFLSDAEDFWELISSRLARTREKSRRVAPVGEFFSHVAERRQFISAMSASQKLHDVLELGEGYFARSIAARLGALPETRSLPASRRTDLGQAYAAAMFGLLMWWLNNEPGATPMEMDAMFHRMVWSGIGAPHTGQTKRGVSLG